MSKNEKCPKCGKHLHPGSCQGLGGGGGDDAPEQAKEREENTTKKDSEAHHTATSPVRPVVIVPTDARGLNLPPVDSIIHNQNSNLTNVGDSNSNEQMSEKEGRKPRTPFNTDIPKPRPDGDS